MSVRLLGYILSVTLLAGCAHASPQLRLSRALVVLGATAMVVGGLVAAGCSEGGAGASGCSGGPASADPDEGVPVMAAGAALIGAGLLAKPKEQSRLFSKPVPPPVPVLPDPFVPTLPLYPP